MGQSLGCDHIEKPKAKNDMLSHNKRVRIRTHEVIAGGATTGLYILLLAGCGHRIEHPMTSSDHIESYAL